jgi:hypothetical protein
MISEVLEILVSRLLGFLGQLPNWQSGPRNNIRFLDKYLMNNGWHVESRGSLKIIQPCIFYIVLILQSSVQILMKCFAELSIRISLTPVILADSR